MLGRRRAGGFFRRLLRIAARPMWGDRGRGGYVVHPYRGYGSRREAFLMGRVFRQTALSDRIPRYGVLRDLADVLRRIIRWGLPEVSVEVSLGENVTTVTTDHDGYFDVHLLLEHPLPDDTSWHHAELHVVMPQAEPVHSFAEIYIPPPSADLLVISDIDDTVMYTGVANKLRMLHRLFVKQAHQRMAFPGVAALYQALHAGPSGNAKRPILYVSRGPWSIYEMLEEFFQLNRIPVGPILFLREWGISWRKPWPRRAEDHKYDVILHMLSMRDDLPCVLIGDSGQHDPEVYARIVHEFPERVRAVYIRRIERKPDRERAIDRLRDEIRHTGCDLMLAEDSLAMAEHAFEQRLISERGLEKVRRESSR
ncbi:App1 family protein [Billgrantia pellis]|nr:phosphatase domain-containing protein [Halomonas pellis]